MMGLFKSAIVAMTFVVIAAQAALAQQSAMSEEIRGQALQELGRVIEPKTKSIICAATGEGALSRG